MEPPVTDYGRKIGWIEVLVAAAVIAGLIWLELNLPQWKVWIALWGFAAYLAITGIRLVIALFRLWNV